MTTSAADLDLMARALDLARMGRGLVEPNPMVGCVIVNNHEIVGSGYHQKFGGPHAEIEALKVAGELARKATAYVTLEPCSHQGKTGPCADALIDAQLDKVVIGCQDPNPKVAGQGIAKLRAAGIEVTTNILQKQAQRLIAPFTKLVTKGRPWGIAKWAMTLDGKIASSTGSSQWISGEASRELVHAIRGSVDAILVGRGTATADDPTLTARPPGPRTPIRIVLDSNATLPSDSQLIKTIDQAPLLIATSQNTTKANCQKLSDLGAEVLPLPGENQSERLTALLKELGQRQVTNLFVEGGSKVFGSLLDLQAIDEVHAFVAPKLIGGQTAFTPIAGDGRTNMNDAIQLHEVQTQKLGNDFHIHGFVN